MTAPDFADILAARRRIAAHVRRTPLERSAALSSRLGGEIHLKLEHRQVTGAFKLRGAANALLALPEARRRAGVTTASTGNHGRALAHAARAAGVPAVICLSRLAPANKVAGVEAMGAEARVIGESQDEAMIEAERLVAEEGMTLIPPFDHADVVAGQGTCGLEIVEDLPDVGTVLVPLSGGGLIAGVALAVKTARPRARVVGVSMTRGAAMAASLAAGHPVEVREEETLADSLGGGVGLDNRVTFAMVRDLVDEVVLLDEAEIAEGIRWAYAAEGEVIEGGAAVGIAALLAGKAAPRGPTVALLSGRNIDLGLHRRVICSDTPWEG
ncbi:hydroxyectoine utilization dehydratase EutB [Limibaculum sp. M0105]|uniref:Hydroxyectoine utilization dehydratase EutB n=1 Tax=Thermohalobaculum xanthum TaxID=2753746 RepID=A0A8J7M894_9RHOB|nr:hydroxyectoine utilization dehydratase EutB [Thermohalobaculum xanthum]MBK0400414.1 hydroxyectoine utilization dehydratase EutB [Thermohalobaculum xanthum]